MDKEKEINTAPRNKIEENTKSQWDSRGLKVSTITNLELKFGVYGVAYKKFQSSKPNIVPCMAVDLGYKIVKKGHKYDIIELKLRQLIENMKTIRVARSNTYKFGSLLVCIFFYMKNYFHSTSQVNWRTDTPAIYQINDFIQILGENFDSVMNEYFENFKEGMDQRFRIPL